MSARRAAPLLCAALLGAASPSGSAAPVVAVRAPAALPSASDASAAPRVRRLSVLIVLYTRSFARMLTPAQIARAHEEVAEFYDFYQTHGDGKVDFDFSLLQIDRELRRDEVDEVAPGKYYLSREDVEGELTARGMKDRHFDEVIALYAWNNANADAATLAYGGGSVGPDGHFLGDAGFNSIGLFAWDIERVGQILIHEVLHNVSDMFEQSGMHGHCSSLDDHSPPTPSPSQPSFHSQSQSQSQPFTCAFYNADEMSKNMARLVAERPGAFLPEYSDEEMLAYAERERAGKDSYPWAMQLVYYGWMLERTPKASWDRLKYGQMVPARPAHGDLRPLYRSIFVSSANDSIFFAAIGDSAAAIDINGICSPLESRPYTQVDFDGSPVYGGRFLAGWFHFPVPLWEQQIRPLTVALVSECGGKERERASVVQQRVGWIDAPASIEVSVARHVPLDVLVRIERMGDSLPAIVRNAQLFASTPVGPLVTSFLGDTGLVAIEDLPLGVASIALRATAPRIFIHGATMHVRRALSWGVVAERQPIGPMDSPVNVTVQAREGAPVDAYATATFRGRRWEMRDIGGGRYTVNLDSLPPGLDTVLVQAARAGGATTVDTVVAWVQPWGYLRVPDSLVAADGAVSLTVRVRSRMGEFTRGLHLPLVAIAGDRAVPLVEDSVGVYRAAVPAPDTVGRLTVVSLVGQFPRRVVPWRVRSAAFDDVAHDASLTAPVAPPPAAPAPSSPVRPAGQATRTPDGTDVAVAPRATMAIDGALGDWAAIPAVTLAPVAAAGGPAGVTPPRPDARRGSVRFAWDDSTLYLAVSVDRDSAAGDTVPPSDRISLALDLNNDDTPLTYGAPDPAPREWQEDDVWLYIRPFGADSLAPEILRAGRAGEAPVAGARVVRRRRAGGWDVEAAIPRRALPRLGLFVGGLAGLQCFVGPEDGPGGTTPLVWHGQWPATGDGASWRWGDLGRLVMTGARPAQGR